MKPYIKRSQKDYSLSFKLSVVSQIERGELTFTQATKQYGIQCRSAQPLKTGSTDTAAWIGVLFAQHRIWRPMP